MESASPPSPSYRGSFVGAFFWAVLFGFAYTQAPLFFSNQNQYFLHGMAHAGHGYLSEDWLANTEDPTPIFSSLVYVTAQYLPLEAFYVYQFLLLGIYYLSLLGIFEYMAGSKLTPTVRLLGAAALVAVHAHLTNKLTSQFLGTVYENLFTDGLAYQYLLGSMLQPSVFGVLLVATLWAFCAGKPWSAVTLAAAAGACHATYLVTAGWLVAGYLLHAVLMKRAGQALFMGLWALVFVAPMVAYHALTFQPTSSASFAEAQRILAHERIPHHALIERFFVGNAPWIQVGWMGLGLLLSVGSRLLAPLLVATAGAAGLTVLQWHLQSDTLALLFPWRTSVILVPVATTIFLARLCALLSPALEALPGVARSALQGLCLAAGLGLAVVGGMLMYKDELFPMERREYDRGEIGVMDFVAANKASGQIYLLPGQTPVPNPENKAVATRPGVRPAAFPQEFQRFRLYTGVPIFVDFKSIPYLDREVLEWHRRVHVNEVFYQKLRDGKSEVVDHLRSHGVTHVIWPAEWPFPDALLDKKYGDEKYCVGELRRAKL
ncbi:MAG: hypothetical protein L0Y72_08665 [Gemmataceae bacterium]|nr:hypothetical protein [Gemmataceae bacterium]MCI0739103.1 hypothetical protein [Gemmataceae bacterium]